MSTAQPPGIPNFYGHAVLVTDEGKLVAVVGVPPFLRGKWPEVLVWGQRHFILDEGARETIRYPAGGDFVTLEGVEVYREAFAYYVLPGHEDHTAELVREAPLERGPCVYGSDPGRLIATESLPFVEGKRLLLTGNATGWPWIARLVRFAVTGDQVPSSLPLPGSMRVGRAVNEFGLVARDQPGGDRAGGDPVLFLFEAFDSSRLVIFRGVAPGSPVDGVVIYSARVDGPVTPLFFVMFREGPLRPDGSNLSFCHSTIAPRLT